jgi:hypothetical protein
MFARLSRTSSVMARICSVASRDMCVPTVSWVVSSSKRPVICSNWFVSSMSFPMWSANLSISATRSLNKARFSPIFVPTDPIAKGSEACSSGRPLGLVMPCTMEMPGTRSTVLAILSKVIRSVVLRMS